jgi:NSS family neurotransmitter:Na+ symporter
MVFILAAIGAAVGLGNIWKFPYVVGVSGGGAFVLVYLLCVFIIAIPILIGELLIGRMGGHSPPVAMRMVAEDSGRSRSWSIVGWMGVIAGFLIATYYSVIAGWTLAYILKAATGFDGSTMAEVAQQFEELKNSPATMTLWHTVFMIISLIIVGRGLHAGIERTVKVLMPALFVMLLVMIGYAAVAGDMGAGIDFLFSTDFSKINADVILDAIGQAFFSIGVAIGLMMAYGSYVPRNISLTKAAVIIASADTLIAVLAGLMIFPIVFANGLDPAEGPGLIFTTLPTAFAGMPGGHIFGSLFFLLLAFAGLTSIIAIIEPVIRYSEDKWGMTRLKGCVIFGFIGWAIGMLSVMSFSLWKGVYPLGMLDAFANMTFYDLIAYVTDNLLMPLGGIFIAVFVGWRLKKEYLDSELSFPSPAIARAWLYLIRFVAPLAILLVMINTLI